MLKRRLKHRQYAEFAQAKGYPCGKRFIPRAFKCWTDPKSGARLKKPLTYQVYKRIKDSKGKAAQKYYADRAENIKRNAFGGSWKKESQETFNKVFAGKELTIDTPQGTARLKYVQDKDVNYLKIYKGKNIKPTNQLLMTKEDLRKYADDLHNPKLAKYFTPSNPRFVDAATSLPSKAAIESKKTRKLKTTRLPIPKRITPERIDRAGSNLSRQYKQLAEQQAALRKEVQRAKQTGDNEAKQKAVNKLTQLTYREGHLQKRFYKIQKLDPRLSENNQGQSQEITQFNRPLKRRLKHRANFNN